MPGICESVRTEGSYDESDNRMSIPSIKFSDTIDRRDKWVPRFLNMKLLAVITSGSTTTFCGMCYSLRFEKKF